jgi:hypothetical protein
MLRMQNAGSKIVIIPVSVASSATATGNIDTMGYDEVKVCVLLDSAASTASKPAVLKLSEADVTNVSSFADITAFVGGGVGGFTIPAVSATLGSIVELNVDTRARKRYLKLSVTPSTNGAMVLGACAVLGRAEDSTAAGALATASVNG